ncbi:UNVERIFIED_CONTAM: hypothetical protein GTU68_058249 [Idotea baltica]|nr:hypothetical protein [Idotea baltica]
MFRSQIFRSPIFLSPIFLSPIFRSLIFPSLQGRVICAPFVFVQFADFWLADQFNTLARVLVDFEHTICFYLNDVSWEPPQNILSVNLTGNKSCASDFRWPSAIVRCLPAWWRFAQCLRRYRDTKEAFPHLLNALKYSTTFFVVTFNILYEPLQYTDHLSNPWFYMLIISRVSSSCFVLWWDLVMDWGLFDKNCGEYKFLREEMVYSSPYYYYFAIFEDIVLRFSWSIPFAIRAGSDEVMITVMALLEVLRRFIWNFFRLENEHLNNCGKFRAVRDISIIPLDASDQAQVSRF